MLRVRLPAGRLLCNDTGQIVHMHVPLSPSSVIWYWTKLEWYPVAGKVNAGLLTIITYLNMHNMSMHVFKIIKKDVNIYNTTLTEQLTLK